MSTQAKLTLVLSEAKGCALVKCPEFGISAFADTMDEAKKILYDNVITASSLIISRKERGLSVDEELLPFADRISNNKKEINSYFTEVHTS